MQLFANNITTSLSAALTSTSTTIQLLSLVGFPVVTSPDHLLITVTGGGNLEILRITSISGSTVTVVRAQEGTTAQVFATNSIVSVNLTKGTLETFRDKEIALDALITASKPKLIGKYYRTSSVSLDAGVYVITIVGCGGGGGGGGNQSSGIDGENGSTTIVSVERGIGADLDYIAKGGTGGSGGYFQAPGCGGGGGGDGITAGFGSNSNGGKGVRGTEGDGAPGGVGGYNVSSILGDKPGDGELIISEQPGLEAGKAAESITVTITLLERATCNMLLGRGGKGGNGGRLPGGSDLPDATASGQQGSGGFVSVLRLG